VIGAGKASVEMARKVEEKFGEQIMDGIIIAPEKSSDLNNIQVFKGTHPYPDEDSVSASYELLSLAKRIPQNDRVIFCLSGGASSLYCIPANGIELDEFKETYKLLLNSGASIHQINVVRKHISETSGGQTALHLSNHKLISLILSDVPGDDPEIVGSGPTVADSSTFKQAFQVLKKYQLWVEIPHSVRIHISKGMHGDISETPKPESHKWDHHRVEMISGAKILAENVGKQLEKEGYHAEVADHAYDEEVKDISRKICSKAISILSKKADITAPAALIYFGESTVNVKGEGKGGRNQELALSAAITLEGQNPVSLLSLATDGVDGPTDAAGAIITSQTTLMARKKKLTPEDYLQNNDSYHFHLEMENLIKTGPTGNNLMDIQVVLVD
jgi:hydroxypyruvate reductase/glycerate 2-kinase